MKLTTQLATADVMFTQTQLINALTAQHDALFTWSELRAQYFQEGPVTLGEVADAHAKWVAASYKVNAARAEVAAACKACIELRQK